MFWLLIRRTRPVNQGQSTTRNVKPPGRPFGSVTRFPGSCVFAAEHGVTPSHVYRVLMGERESLRLRLAYAKWLRERGLPWPQDAKVAPTA